MTLWTGSTVPQPSIFRDLEARARLRDSDLNERANYSINSMLETFDEVVYVDWNTEDGKNILTEESTQKVCKITGKSVLKGNKLQLNTEDGRSFLVEKDTYKVGDSIITELPKQKIINHLPLDKGALVYLIEGTQVGHVATVEAVEETPIVESVEEAPLVEAVEAAPVVEAVVETEAPIAEESAAEDTSAPEASEESEEK